MVVISNYLSDKIKIISFFLIISVIYIHSGFHADEIDGMYLNYIVQGTIGGILGRLAVPVFFIISGFLFFNNYFKKSFSFAKKMKARFKSLLIPYIIGCLFVLLWMVALSYIPFFGENMNQSYFKSINIPVLKLAKNLFIANSNKYTPLAYHLWFIRDLIVIVIISPVLIIFIKNLKWIFIGALLIASLTFPFDFINSIMYFSIGAIFNFLILKQNNYKHIGIYILLFYITISFIELFTGMMHHHNFKNLFIIIGVIALWLSYDQFVSSKFILNKNKWLNFLCNYTFFIYVFQSPTINVFRHGIVSFTGKNQVGYLISYITSPLILILVFVCIGYYLNKIIPSIYSILVGGRN